MVEVYEPLEDEELERFGRAWSLLDKVGEMGTSRHISSAWCPAKAGWLVRATVRFLFDRRPWEHDQCECLQYESGSMLN